MLQFECVVCRVEVSQSGGWVGGSSCKLHGMVAFDAGKTVTPAVLAVCAVRILELAFI